MELQHQNFLVDIVNKAGDPISQKLRKDIDKTKDLYHAVYVLVVTPDKKLVLSTIPSRNDLPNLYFERLGVTVATILRHGESPKNAALRALSSEIYCNNNAVNHLGSSYVALPDGHNTYLSAYYVINMYPDTFSKKDIKSIKLLNSDELDSLVSKSSEDISPTLSLIWKTYRHLIMA